MILYYEHYVIVFVCVGGGGGVDLNVNLMHPNHFILCYPKSFPCTLNVLAFFFLSSF